MRALQFEVRTRPPPLPPQMYAKLRYTALHQRAQSTSCETLASQLIIGRLEGSQALAGLAQPPEAAWIAKRNDYAVDVAQPAYLFLDYALRSCLAPAPLSAAFDAAVLRLSSHQQCTFLEIQRACALVRMHVANARGTGLLQPPVTPRDHDDANAAALLAALNLGASLDMFLWRNANVQWPINVF